MEKIEKNSLYGESKKCKIVHKSCNECGLKSKCFIEAGNIYIPNCEGCIFIRTDINKYPCRECKGLKDVTTCHYVESAGV